MMDQYGKIWFKDHIDSKLTPTHHGPNKLKTCWRNFNPHHQKGNEDVSGQTMLLGLEFPVEEFLNYSTTTLLLYYSYL